MKRRNFLAGALSLGAALGLAAKGRGQSTVPPALGTGTSVSLRDVRRLIAERVDPVLGRCRYLADKVVQPILVARRGERFDAVIENSLPQPTTVHFHGLTLAESQDGAGFVEIAPGEKQRVRFEVRNRSGLYWFHPHPHGLTAEQVHAGLAGLLVVVDEDDAALDAALGLDRKSHV